MTVPKPAPQLLGPSKPPTAPVYGTTKRAAPEIGRDNAKKSKVAYAPALGELETQPSSPILLT
jgi:hypothetical protein